MPRMPVDASASVMINDQKLKLAKIPYLGRYVASET